MEIQNLDVYAAKLSLDCVAECDDEAAKDDGQNIKNGSDAPRKTGASLDCCSVREYNASLSERLWAIQNLDVYAAELSLDCVAEYSTIGNDKNYNHNDDDNDEDKHNK